MYYCDILEKPSLFACLFFKKLHSVKRLKELLPLLAFDFNAYGKVFSTNNKPVSGILPETGNRVEAMKFFNLIIDLTG